MPRRVLELVFRWLASWLAAGQDSKAAAFLQTDLKRKAKSNPATVTVAVLPFSLDLGALVLFFVFRGGRSTIVF